MPFSPRTVRTSSRSRTSALTLAAALPVWARWAGHRFALPLLFALAAVCVTLGQSREAELSALRMRVSQGLVPVWQALAAPGQALNDMSDTISDWRQLQTENARLRADNAALLQWRETANRLATENARLTQLTAFVAPPQTKALTARIVADIGGPYQNAVLALAGARDGIAAGAVVLGAKGGVIGRVTELSETTARILLLTDPGSRIPVRLEQSGAAAIATGTGHETAELLYMPRDMTPQAGERVLTSGHGGIFPAGLPVGTMEPTTGNALAVAPLDAGATSEIVHIVDFRIGQPDKTNAPATAK